MLKSFNTNNVTFTTKLMFVEKYIHLVWSRASFLRGRREGTYVSRRKWPRLSGHLEQKEE